MIEAGDPQPGGVFQAQRWLFEGRLVAFLEGSGPVGPEQLIKMATGQLPELRSRRQWRHL